MAELSGPEQEDDGDTSQPIARHCLLFIIFIFDPCRDGQIARPDPLPLVKLLDHIVCGPHASVVGHIPRTALHGHMRNDAIRF